MGVVHAIKWAVQRAPYFTLESVAQLRDKLTLALPPMVALSIRPKPEDRRARAGELDTSKNSGL
ncbi:hypothetical protein QH494_26640 [Sphingomonas sp. AR_OL41]|uniref:hypothetical protein n=1 Tax=Sphingomonas sp. AR_OL41 TaxID=3042729 RepID=UPI0024819647|nr:hypothetical protein [Sphingomonas sp. AR_OL41]MDH7975778.1 hypothetical protein [Sphingomonas sp. AR_OL41]